MLAAEQLAKLRFGMNALPEIGGNPGTYEERWAQWFLEQSFFRDFVYRNPRGKKKGEELADAVVLFGDVALLVQVKAQCGAHTPTAWATEALLKALAQLRETHKALNDGSIKKFRNDFYGNLEFKSVSYPNQFGIIILAQRPTTPYIAAELVPELLKEPFPIHIFSLADFQMVAARFDTAGDLITFLELRSDVAARIVLRVHDEEGNIGRMLPHVKDVIALHSAPMTSDVLDGTFESFTLRATGRLLASDDWRYGLAIDDMIAHSHDLDPALPWNQGDEPAAALRVARFLGWLTRDRRIKLGKRMVLMCEEAKDGKNHYFNYRKPNRKIACVFLATSLSREDRVAYLNFLVSYAHMKYDLKECLGVATEPLGPGRSYDFIMIRKPLPDSVRDELKGHDDPFATGEIAL